MTKSHLGMKEFVFHTNNSPSLRGVLAEIEGRNLKAGTKRSDTGMFLTVWLPVVFSACILLPLGSRI